MRSTEKVKGRTAAVLCAAALAITAGCGSGGTTGDEAGGDGEQLSIGMSISTLNNPFFVAMRSGAEGAAESAGADITVQDAQNDAATQANHLQTFLTQGTAAVIVNPVDSQAAAAPVREAGEADVPVVAADRSVVGANTATTVASNNVEGGKMAARTLADAVGESGTVVVLQGTPGTSAARDRGNGFQQAIENFENITVAARQPANFDRTEALNVMTNVLQSHSDVEGVFAQNDEMALGAIEALGDRASDVPVVGFDGTPDGLEAVQQGTMHATIAQQPEKLGKRSVELAIQAARGEQIPGEVKIPVQAVTQDNIDEFRGS